MIPVFSIGCDQRTKTLVAFPFGQETSTCDCADKILATRPPRSWRAASKPSGAPKPRLSISHEDFCAVLSMTCKDFAPNFLFIMQSVFCNCYTVWFFETLPRRALFHDHSVGNRYGRCRNRNCWVYTSVWSPLMYSPLPY